ncbi:response regulator [Undibacterium fentianense]|uniref:Response regulator n=1 Tax=Undibacterium fentianense TaxID=2828728 RepID=A0A941ICI3_9BURK|nr:response regulator [Undibacterium fentianense]MBR7798903.1 response regulator [Undibacterium fentianense]
MRILLAEDNDFNQEIAVELLTEAGYEVTAVEDGQALLDILFAKPPRYYSLILMDLEMPVMDGHEATVQIRKHAQFAYLPIIALTAHKTDETKRRCQQEGMQDFLSKPFEASDFYQILSTWLEKNEHDLTRQEEGHALTELPALKSIDVERGFALSGRNLALYLHLLDRFRHSQVDMLLKLREFDFSQLFSLEFKRQIHTQKGVCGTIGAIQLASALEYFESQLINKIIATENDNQFQSEIKSQLSQICKLLESTIDEINDFFANDKTPQAVPAHPASDISTPQEFQELKRELIALLETGSAEAIDLFELHRLQFESRLTKSLFDAFSEALQNYNFDQACSILKT